MLGVSELKGEDDPVIAGSRILVADDEPNIRTTISDILRKYKAHVTVCENGGEAIAQIAAQDFDLIVSDIKMPDKSGYDVFAAARKRSQTLPVILMTGFGYDPNHSIVRASQEAFRPSSYALQGGPTARRVRRRSSSNPTAPYSFLVIYLTRGSVGRQRSARPGQMIALVAAATPHRTR